MTDKRTEIATLAGGCFWCTEAVIQRLRGVDRVVPGYTGGHVPNPTYQDVCTGTTGHAEAIQVHFDPDVISYEQLLEVFFALHDPTTLNRQDADVGPQYRSAVYYHGEAQKQTVERVIAEVNASGMYPNPVVTEVAPAGEYYVAEDYHHNFYEDNKSYPYCTVVIDPKVQKLYKNFEPLLA
ncbi:MAG TPA: peptide-methionine (S)-S-oxide reductase MsrA [Dehalococcoidia bacterium]|nr:peptide-methionine (S)-S-oxide reductase MsrA [Dehalococcoidia bacterium]